MRQTTGRRWRHERTRAPVNASPYRLLIMRRDLVGRLKEQCIADSLCMDSFHQSRANEASVKEYSASYRDFIAAIRVPDSCAARMLKSKYARHFYSAGERDAAYARWTGSSRDHDR